MKKALLAFVVVVVFAASALTALAAQPPDEIALPNGHMPERIEVAGNTFYAGSRRDGSVYAGDVRTGEGSELVPGIAGRSRPDSRSTAVVCGCPARVPAERGSTTRTRAPRRCLLVRDRLRRSSTTSSSHGTPRGSRIRRTPSCTASRSGPAASPADTFETVELEGDFVQQMGFNTNGIAATPNGKTLVIVQSNTGKLFTVTPERRSHRRDRARGRSKPAATDPPRRKDALRRAEPAEHDREDRLRPRGGRRV